MKIAIFALTNAGRRLAGRIAAAYPGADLYFKEGYATEGREGSFANLTQTVGELFAVYEGLVFIMAAGIAVRVISPFIRHKSVDPAVVVIDEGGNFAISLLSGHLGGANALAGELAALMGAAPVITTATDVQGRPAMDMVARKLGLSPEPVQHLKDVNSAIVNGGRVGIYTDMPKTLLLDRCPELADEGIEILALPEQPDEMKRFDAVVAMTDRLFVAPEGCPDIYLRPGTLVAGIGCRRGIGPEEILQAVTEACTEGGYGTGAVKALATAWLKTDEPGIREAAEALLVPLRIFSGEALAACTARYGLAESNYVMKQIGVGAVCEPAAILGTKQGELVVPKQKYAGITVAIARESSPWWA